MWQIKGDMLCSIYSSFLKKCKLAVMIINQLVLPFSRKRPVTCYNITQSCLVSRINSSFSSHFMICECLFLRLIFLTGREGNTVRFGEKKTKRRKKSHHLSSRWREQEHFLSPLPLLPHFSSSSYCSFPINLSRLSFWDCVKSCAGKT